MRPSLIISLEVLFLTLGSLGLLGLRQATARSAQRLHGLESQAAQLQRQLDACQVKIAHAHQPEALLGRVPTPLAPPEPSRTIWLRESVSSHPLHLAYQETPQPRTLASLLKDKAH